MSVLNVRKIALDLVKDTGIFDVGAISQRAIVAVMSLIVDGFCDSTTVWRCIAKSGSALTELRACVSPSQ